MNNRRDVKIIGFLRLIVFALGIAVLTLPIIHLTGIHAVLVQMSVWLTNNLFLFFGIPF